jgi:tetratricopeptide (TPR) repeat protein
MKIFLAIGLAALGMTSGFADTRILLDNVTVNGKPVTMAFDSGCATGFLTSKAVKRLGLRVTVPPTNGPGDTTVYTVNFDGHSIQTDFAIINFPPGAGVDVDGVLGWGPLSSNILRIDAPALQFTFLSKVPAGVKCWNQLFLDTNSSTLDLKIPGQNIISIDTGSADGIELPPREWKRWKKAHPRSPITLNAFATVDGIYAVEESWADQFQIGPLIFNDVPIMAESRGMEKEAGSHHDIIGLAALSRLDLVLDGIHNVAYLRMRQTPPPRYSYNRLGAVFIPIARHPNRLVARVAAGSPAYEAGIRNGDIFLSVDEQGVSGWINGSGDISSDGYSLPAGTTVHLKLQRHRKSIETTVTFRDILPPSHRKYPSQDYSIGDPEFDAETYYGQGLLMQSRGDLKTALSNCVEAIKIDPNFALAYAFRGYLEGTNGSLDAALADYNKAINLGFVTANAFYSRAILEGDKGNVTAALADYSKVIELDPHWAEIYCYRGWLEQTNGDLKGACADYSEVIALEPDWAPYYGYRSQVEQRQGNLTSAEAAKLDSSLATNAASQLLGLGYLRYERQNFTNALSDFERACALNPSDGCAHLGVWLWASQLGESQAANMALQSFLAGRKAENARDWPLEVGRFLNGQATQEELLKTAEADGDKDKSLYCSACFFVGSRCLIAGDRSAAVAYFQKCLSAGAKDSAEYEMAKAELRLLSHKTN